ncbi:unnamed protein product, partial [Phaeothamnion confervicola]
NRYGDDDYWEARYAGADATYDWLLGWADVASYLTPLVPPLARALHVGCGNSTLGVDLWRAGLARGGGVVNTDISATVIAQMARRFGN